MNSVEVKIELKKIIFSEGFEMVGFCKPEISTDDILNYDRFVDENRFADMLWFINGIVSRKFPIHYFPECRTVIVMGSLYRSEKHDKLIGDSDLKIARYASGLDYHKVLKKKCKRILGKIKDKYPEIDGKSCVDTSPVPEKSLALKAGIGWRGKNTLIVNPVYGSFFFLSLLFLNIEIEPDDEIPSKCGKCNLCVEVCPTNALTAFEITPTRCISYLTVEKKEMIPEQFQNRLDSWIFGCDLCQEVCPYNSISRNSSNYTRSPEFEPNPIVVDLLENDMLPSEDRWDELKRGTPMSRTSYKKIQDNIRCAKKSKEKSSEKWENRGS